MQNSRKERASSARWTWYANDTHFHNTFHPVSRPEVPVVVVNEDRGSENQSQRRDDRQMQPLTRSD
jgi:hypothetical protein